MKDLALSQGLSDLVAGGVHSFKIEGRKKSPLYVAATTAFYRDLLDGKLTADQFRQRQEELKTIFAPGFSTKKRGWGLGLSLVRRIVKEYHKGKVFVLESQLGVGTTFRISIPADR